MLTAVAERQTRERIVDAAWEIARERGLPELTLARVGRRAGVSRQAVYLHFGNRATLLVAMARRADQKSGFAARVSAARDLPPRPALRQLLRAWFDYLPTILPTARALEAANVTGDDGAQAYADRMKDWLDVIRAAVARLAEAGELDVRWDVSSASDWVWASVHPSRYHHLVHERGWNPEEAAARTIDSLERELLSARVRDLPPRAALQPAAAGRGRHGRS
jgi:AcrR family transcriptional regulator